VEEEEEEGVQEAEVEEVEEAEVGEAAVVSGEEKEADEDEDEGEDGRTRSGIHGMRLTGQSTQIAAAIIDCSLGGVFAVLVVYRAPWLSQSANRYRQSPP
jgi:hypothetical protein